MEKDKARTDKMVYTSEELIDGGLTVVIEPNSEVLIDELLFNNNAITELYIDVDMRHACNDVSVQLNNGYNWVCVRSYLEGVVIEKTDQSKKLLSLSKQRYIIREMKPEDRDKAIEE